MMAAARNLTKTYKKRNVVEGLNFEVEENEVFALLGSNGAGKSTTIKMLLGLVKRDGGSIVMKEGIVTGYSPETPYFPPFLTGTEVLEYYAGLQKIPVQDRHKMVGDLLEKVGLEKDHVKVKVYSKGMLQRLALAQALIGNPSLLVLDEPCAGLDAMGRIEMLEIIRGLKRQGKTVIINSHILSDIEKVCDRGIIMGKGKKLRDFERDDLTDGTSLEALFVNAAKSLHS